MKKINKILIFLLLLPVLLLSGCNNSKKYVNEIITQNVEYKENITIYDVEDALVLATKKAEASVVGIESNSKLTKGFGSGVIFKVEQITTGYKYYVLTNFHVISYNDRLNQTINIYLGEYKETISAKCEDYDSKNDSAVLSFISSRLLPAASLADSTKLEKSRFVIAVGNPYDLKTYYKSSTVGYVSHPNRECLDENNVLNYYIQHTAPINSGNSGGGLFDIHGNLVGINTWKYATEEIEGMGFAIPVHILRSRYTKYFN